MWTQNRYNPQEREAHRQQRRLEHKTYAFDIENESKEVFSIDTPPPTISWKLHIWHIFSYTQAELIARYKRMKWFNVFYPMGYDNNWIPTENLVEKELWIDIKNVERRDFIKSCAEINKKYKEVYKNLRVSLWMSVDRDQSYATISPEVQQLVQQRFVKMFEAWQIVSKEFPALRCTKNQTTIAQAETEEIECDSFYNYVRFAIEDGWEIVIATTRPELMPACVAVVVNPTDARYTKFL